MRRIGSKRRKKEKKKKKKKKKKRASERELKLWGKAKHTCTLLVESNMAGP